MNKGGEQIIHFSYKKEKNANSSLLKRTSYGFLEQYPEFSKIHEKLHFINKPVELFYDFKVINILKKLEQKNIFFEYYQVSKNRGIISTVLHRAMDNTFIKLNYELIAVYSTGNIYIGKRKIPSNFIELVIDQLSIEIKKLLTNPKYVKKYMKLKVNSNIFLLHEIISLYSINQIIRILHESKCKSSVIIKALIIINQTIRKKIQDNYEYPKKFDNIEKKYFKINSKNIKNSNRSRFYREILRKIETTEDTIFKKYNSFINEIMKIYPKEKYPKLYDVDTCSFAKILIQDLAHPIDKTNNLLNQIERYVFPKGDKNVKYFRCETCDNVDYIQIKEQKTKHICRLCILEKLLRGKDNRLIIGIVKNPQYYIDFEYETVHHKDKIIYYSKNQIVFIIKETNLDNQLEVLYYLYKQYNKNLEAYQFENIADFGFGIKIFNRKKDFIYIHINDFSLKIRKDKIERVFQKFYNVKSYFENPMDIFILPYFQIISQIIKIKKNKKQIISDIKYIKENLEYRSLIRLGYNLGNKLARYYKDNKDIELFNFSEELDFKTIFPEFSDSEMSYTIVKIANTIDNKINQCNNILKVKFAQALRTSFYTAVTINGEGENEYKYNIEQ